MNFQEVAAEVAKLVEEKQKAYGDSFGKSGEILKILYPDGVPVEKYGDMLTIVRVVDKLFRIATDRDALGENPWKDVNGYSLLALVRADSYNRTQVGCPFCRKSLSACGRCSECCSRSPNTCRGHKEYKE